MANKGIKGITIEIGGDTKALNKALEGVNNQSKSLQDELKAVERGLKFDPGNVELVRQKQELLTASIASTSDKLDVLRTAQSQVQAQFERNEIGVEQYRAFRRELQQTEGELNRLQGQLGSLGAEQDRLSQTTRQLGTFFEATGTDVEQFSGTLGTRLTQAIRDGSASADQMERALRLMGQQALGAGIDVDQLREALRNADNGANLDEIRQDLARITEESNAAEDAVNGFGQELTSVIGGLVAGGGIEGVVSAALDTSSLDTKIDISFNVPEESKQSILGAIKSIDKYGVEGEEALEGVRRQWALNKDASDATNASIVEGAGVIAKTYAGIDFIELIQEVNEIASALEISNEEALYLTNSLLKFGFPPEQLDTIAEYGLQMKDIGYNTAQIQAIFENGVDLKTWNIDNLNDGVKEANIKMKEYGKEVPKALAAVLKGTTVSTKEMQNWGKAVASGGEEGAKAMSEVSAWLQTIEDDSLRNEMAIAVFGTKAEDQGDNMIAVFQGLADAQGKTIQNQNEFNASAERYNADPMVQMKDAVNDMMIAFKPLLMGIAGIVSMLAEWASNNPILVASLIAIGTAIGILVGGFAVLMPAIGSLVSLWPALVLAIAGIGAPILIVIGAIAALATAFVALWQNSETFRNNLSSVFESIKNVAVTVFETVASFIGEKIAQIKQFWDTDGAQILQAAENIFNGIMAVIQFVMPAIELIIKIVWTAIQQIISGALNVIMGIVKIFSGLFTGDFSKMWEGVKQLFFGAINVIIGWLSLTFVGGIRSLLANLGKSALSLIKGMWDNVFGVFKTMGGSIRSFTDDTLSKVIGFFRNFVTNVKTQMSNAKQGVEDIWGKAVDFLKGINLKQIGKDIIQGLVNGIGSMASLVTDKVKEIANSIPKWAKDILGIASPSRVMALIGKWVGIGLADGIDSTSNRVAKSMQDIGYAIIDIMDHYKSETIKIEKATSAEITKINKRTNEDIEKIQNAAYAKKRKINESENIKIQRLREDSAKKIADIEKKSAADSFKILETSNKEMLEGVKLFIQDKKSLEQLSLVDEALIWQESAKLFSDGTKEKIEAQKLYKTAVDTINKEMVAINTNYQGQIQKINDDLKKGEEDLTKTYQDAYSGRVDAIRNFVGQFEAFVVTNDKSGQDLLNNAQSQVDGLKAWRETLDSLWGKIDDQALMEELEALGPKALGELQALNTLSADELTRYTELYNEKFMLAREQASEELAGMKEDTELRIIEMRLAANTQLGVLEREWLLSIQSITRTTDTELSSLHQVGVNAGQGLLDGLASMEGSLITKATQIANAISAAIQSALQIHSPSRVMKGFGINIGEGLIVGMDDMLAKVSNSSRRLADSVSNVYGSLANSANKSMGYSSPSPSSTSTVDNSKNYNPTFQIYTVESPEKVIKREMRKMVFGL
ncbi:phage tail protein [Psychrobacillus sp. FSL K6-1464]|uniref:phage tail protein n=1 Tax=Psychrobacillus sp. FSL K6-1464 TaxID=2921545 RepID=UPI0030FA213F